AKVRQEPTGIRSRQLVERAQAGERRPPSLRQGAGLGEKSLEDRIACVLGDALPAQEWQVSKIEIADPPAEHRRVERDDDRLAAAVLRARDEALDELVRGSRIELEPARAIAHRLRTALHGDRSLV